MAATGPAYYLDRDGGQRGRPWTHYSQGHAAPPTSRGVSSRQTTPVSGVEDWTPSAMRVPTGFSAATLENGRYHVNDVPTSDHSNEDRQFALDGDNFQVFAVFDGHEGPRAAGFASNYFVQLFSSDSWKRVAARESPSKDILKALGEFFKSTEKDFFKSIKPIIDEKNALQAVIPPGMKSYQAYQLYPVEVARIQELEPKIAGGCTAAVAVICQNKLYVANVGDSRVVLVRELPNGTLKAEQLTVDHTTDNEDELKRLEALGLDPKQLIKAGRLGSQENTRSIGDYAIKEGYRNVDVLSRARKPPGTAEPYLAQPVDIDSSFRYLMVMSDGVYKSVEAVMPNQDLIESNKVLIGMFNKVLKGRVETVSDRLLDRLSRVHQDTYQREATKDPRSPLAVSCRKRDDMTLLIYKFPIDSEV